METYDVTIVGAGLAGLQCARLLGKQGLRVLLVDRKRFVDEKVHTTGIFVRKTLTDFEIPEDCLGPSIRHVTLYSPSHRALSLVSEHEEFRIGRMGQLYYRMLNQCLISGVHWLPDTSYLDYSGRTLDLNVRLSVGSTHQTIKSRFLIGSDGACSRVAKDLQLDTNREWIVGVENVLTDVALDGPPQLLCFIDPNLAPGYIGWIAHDGSETHIGVGGYATFFDPAAALLQFQSSVADIVDLSRAKQIERRGGRIPVGGILKKIANKRGLLIGDAAGAVSPLTAGGLDPCMRLSTFAAGVVVDYLSTGDPAVIDQYSGSRFRARFASRLWARRISSTFRQRSMIELGCAALRLPLLRRLAAHVFFGRGSFPDVEMKLMTEGLTPLKS
jgi:flavin-dependent dehydrogenase